MLNKLAVKTLSATDLTVFEWHYRNQVDWRVRDKADPDRVPKSNQKAINLDKDPFVKVLFPGLRDVSKAIYGVNLIMFGPAGQAADVRANRTVSLSRKNWRLNGLIDNPEDSRRYDHLRPGDLAVMSFGGTTTPRVVSCLFLRRGTSDSDLPDPDPGDVALAKELAPGTSMEMLSPADLRAAAEAAQLDADHPIFSLLMEEVATIAVTGTPTPPQRQNIIDTPVYPGGMSKARLAEIKRRNDDAGELGERFVDAYFGGRKRSGEVSNYAWVSAELADSPFDFEYLVPGEEQFHRLDVKATRGPFDNAIFLSVNEMKAVLQDAPYEIFRVFEMDDDAGQAQLRICSDLSEFARDVLSALSNLPDGVGVGALSFSPNKLAFSEATTLELAANGTAVF